MGKSLTNHWLWSVRASNILTCCRACPLAYSRRRSSASLLYQPRDSNVWQDDYVGFGASAVFRTSFTTAQDRFLLFLMGSRWGVALVGSGWCASLRLGPRVCVKGACGLLLRAWGRGWVACSLPFSLPPFCCVVFCLCWAFWLFLSSSLLASRLVCWSVCLPPRWPRGGVPALLVFRFLASLLPWLHLTLTSKV